MHVYIHINNIHMCMYTYILIRMWMYTYILLRMWIYTYILIQMYINAYVYVYIYRVTYVYSISQLRRSFAMVDVVLMRLWKWWQPSIVRVCAQGAQIIRQFPSTLPFIPSCPSSETLNLILEFLFEHDNWLMTTCPGFSHSLSLSLSVPLIFSL